MLGKFCVLLGLLVEVSHASLRTRDDSDNEAWPFKLCKNVVSICHVATRFLPLFDSTMSR